MASPRECAGNDPPCQQCPVQPGWHVDDHVRHAHPGPPLGLEEELEVYFAVGGSRRGARLACRRRQDPFPGLSEPVAGSSISRWTHLLGSRDQDRRVFMASESGWTLDRGLERFWVDPSLRCARKEGTKSLQGASSA